MSPIKPSVGFFRFAYLLALPVTLLALSGCGTSSAVRGAEGGGSATALTLKATVEEPSESSDTAALTILRGNHWNKRQVADGTPCHLEDSDGNVIEGTEDTLTVDGVAEFDLTEEQVAHLEDGVHVVAEPTDEDSGNTYALETVAVYTEEEITEAQDGEGVIEEEVNDQTTFAAAALEDECSDGIKTCKDSMDPKAFLESFLASLELSNEASTDNLGGNIAALFQAARQMMFNPPAGGGFRPARIMRKAFGGDLTELTAQVGEEVGGVPMADAATNGPKMFKKIRESYCERTPGAFSPWGDLKKGASDFDGRAMVGIFIEFTPTEIDEYEAEDFLGYAQNIPNLSGGFQMFGLHAEARRTAVEQFRFGAFNDPTKAGAAMGLMAATFPPPPVAGDWANMDFRGNNFNPTVAGRACYNSFTQYTASATTFANPADIYSKFNSTFSDPTKRQSFATGGKASGLDTIMSGFATHGPTNFDPAAYQSYIKGPPGSSCKSDGDCLPCDKCQNSVCTSMSSKMGRSCASSSDCDSVTTCVGGQFSAVGAQCMCAAGVDKGMHVYSEANKGPMEFGAPGGYTGPVAGGPGSPCGQGKPACLSGNTCSSTTYGMCMPSTFKKGPYAPCTANTECESGTCADGGTFGKMCAQFTSTQIGTINAGAGGVSGTGAIGVRAVGQPCGGPSECSTFYCSAGVCAAPPTAFNSAITEIKKIAGATCTATYECAPPLYCAGTCQSSTASTSTTGGTTYTAPTNLPVGSYCNSSSECNTALYHYCNYSNHQCTESQTATTTGGTTGTTTGGTTTTTTGGTTGTTTSTSAFNGTYRVTSTASTSASCYDLAYNTTTTLSGPSAGPITNGHGFSFTPTANSSSCTGSVFGGFCSNCTYTASGSLVSLSGCSGMCTAVELTKQ